jgi:hypothetical protein
MKRQLHHRTPWLSRQPGSPAIRLISNPTDRNLLSETIWLCAKRHSCYLARATCYGAPAPKPTPRLTGTLANRQSGHPTDRNSYLKRFSYARNHHPANLLPATAQAPNSPSPPDSPPPTAATISTSHSHPPPSRSSPAILFPSSCAAQGWRLTLPVYLRSLRV